MSAELQAAQRDFAAHIAACRRCWELLKCWELDSICRQLVAAGIFE